MNISKIDSQLFNYVESLSGNSDIDCLIYANNFNLAKIFLRKKKFKILYEFPFINAIAISVNCNNLNFISNLNCVNYITRNAKVSTLINVSKDVLKLPKIKNSNKISVAVIDTGISNIIDFNIPKKRIIKFKDFVNDKKFVYDDNGHGTFVSSIIAGSGLVSGGVYSGICDDCNIISLKALNGKGEGSAYEIINAMQWVYDNYKKYNIKVVCMSFGALPADRNDPLMMGAEILWNSGITVVSAAGNSGPETKSIKSPGTSFKIITVGALDDGRSDSLKIDINKFKVAEFSSRGPSFGHYKPDLLAPGVNIKSACNYPLLKTHYSVMSGTSVATPIVAGIIVKMLNLDPKLTPYSIKHILISSCDKLTGNKNEEGYGVINCNRIFSKLKNKG